LWILVNGSRKRLKPESLSGIESLWLVVEVLEVIDCTVVVESKPELFSSNVDSPEKDDGW
jgi:hypothetical protein